jgi:hypothetical protein
MKRILLSVLIVAALVLALAAPAFADDPPNNSQVWYLNSNTMNDKWGNSELYMSTTGTPNGSINVPQGASKMWIADKVALADVTFPNDQWAIRFGTDASWGWTYDPANGMPVSNFKVEIGYWDGASFTVFAMDSNPVWYSSHYESQFQAVPELGQTIPQDTYLAVVVTNLNGTAHPIYTGYQIKTNGSYYFSCLTSPQTDPGYPLPELGAIILLGGGLLGLGGFMIVRRRKASQAV